MADRPNVSDPSQLRRYGFDEVLDDIEALSEYADALEGDIENMETDQERTDDELESARDDIAALEVKIAGLESQLDAYTESRANG